MAPALVNGHLYMLSHGLLDVLSHFYGSTNPPYLSLFNHSIILHDNINIRLIVDSNQYTKSLFSHVRLPLLGN
jgi:hypothetical protein